MLLNLNTALKALDGKENIKDSDGAELTLGAIICATMLMTAPGDDSLSADKKVNMFHIAQRAVDKGEQEFSVEEVALMKERIGKMYGPLVVGRCYEILK